MKKLSVDKVSSKGIAIGRAYKYEKVTLEADNYIADDKEVELRKFYNAVTSASDDLKKLAKNNQIFAAHLELVNDVAIKDAIEIKVKQGSNVEMALKETINEFIAIFEIMDNEYMRQRADDIRDVYQRLLSKIKNIPLKNLSAINEESIIIASDLAPSDTATMNLEYVVGFATEYGGVTSHVSIMARNLGLSALVGVDGLRAAVNDGDMIIIDTTKGDLYINPDSAIIDEFKQKKIDYDKKEEELRAIAHLPAITKDGKKILMYSNVGNLDDVKSAVKQQVDGIGLFRSEFLYMENSHFPTEEEQFLVYKAAAETCRGEVIIRTLDIGGDKELSYYEFVKEDNPFLGWRAIRICLELKDMFKTQLKALLRASAFGHISIMYPMIISVEEIFAANDLLNECRQELESKGIDYDKNIKVGMMIETAASVIEAENFAEYVDFFSIGTNDLTQYILEVDRGNKKISNLYDSFHPAVLHSIQKVIDAGHKAGIVVGMCGEFASDEKACQLLLGMGLDEYSVAYSQIPTIKNIIRNANYEECKQIANKIRTAYTKREVDEILAEF